MAFGKKPPKAWRFLTKLHAGTFVENLSMINVPMDLPVKALMFGGLGGMGYGAKGCAVGEEIRFFVRRGEL